MGVRVLSGDQTGYAYVEGVSMEEMLRAAQTAARIASSGKSVKPVGFKENVLKNNRYSVVTPWEEVSLKAKIPYLQKLNDKIFALDARVRKVQARLNDATTHVEYLRSDLMHQNYEARKLMPGVHFPYHQSGRSHSVYTIRLPIPNIPEYGRR